MQWEEYYEQLDLLKLRVHAHKRAIRFGVLNLHTVDEIVMEALYNSWVKLHTTYDPSRGRFQTWVITLINGVITKFARETVWPSIPVMMPGPPNPLDVLIRREEIASAHMKIKKIEMAIRAATGDAAATDLRVFKAYLGALASAGDERVRDIQVAQAIGMSRRTVSVALGRIAERCQKAGISL